VSEREPDTKIPSDNGTLPPSSLSIVNLPEVAHAAENSSGCEHRPALRECRFADLPGAYETGDGVFRSEMFTIGECLRI
jgi:hypothetical protein